MLAMCMLTCHETLYFQYVNLYEQVCTSLKTTIALIMSIIKGTVDICTFFGAISFPPVQKAKLSRRHGK